MTKLKLLAYNTRTGFGNELTFKKLLKFVEAQNPDIAFFSDALPQDIPVDKLDALKTSLRDLGYDILISDTERMDRTDWTRPMGIMKQSLEARHFYNGVRSETYNVELNGKFIVGKHFDDRNENFRLHRVEDLSKASVLMGDFNAMHRNNPLAYVLRMFIPIGNQLKEVNTDVSVTKNPTLRLISLFQRFTRMGQGDLLTKLVSFGFIETNKKYIPTMYGIAQLDHILVKPEVKFSNFKVHKNVKFSDHKPISLDIEF